MLCINCNNKTNNKIEIEDFVTLFICQECIKINNLIPILKKNIPKDTFINKNVYENI